MATVFIPPLMRELTGGESKVEVDGASVRQVVNALEMRFPGMRARLIVDDLLNPIVHVAVDGTVSRLGLLERVEAGSEVHFLPAIAGGASNPISHTERLISITTEDGLALDGAIFLPERRATDAIAVFVHGLTGRFSSPVTVGICRALAARGIAAISGNNRGHDFGFPVNRPDGTRTLYGGGWERFTEAPLDIAAWIDRATVERPGGVILIGHSLGALKVGQYQASRQDPRVKVLVAASPPLGASRLNPELLALARQMVADGREQDLLPWGSSRAGAGTHSAGTYLDRERGNLDVYGDHTANPPVSRIAVPLLALFGTDEAWVGGAAELAVIRRHATASPRVETCLIAGADHSYTGLTDEAGAAIARFALAET
jgi:alpha-beta hydrolase superfamily lysophospholipase/molybdopterin converting factor small subunit